MGLLNSRRRTVLGLAILALGLAAWVPVSAAADKAKPAPTPANQAELDQLKEAYHTLSVADHDYKGHRVKAMHALEKACDLLGSDIRGNGKGHETQPVSDAQLKEAQAEVEKVQSAIPAGTEKALTGHLNEAIKEIGIALTIK